MEIGVHIIGPCVKIRERLMEILGVQILGVQIVSVQIGVQTLAQVGETQVGDRHGETTLKSEPWRASPGGSLDPLREDCAVF